MTAAHYATYIGPGVGGWTCVCGATGTGKPAWHAHYPIDAPKETPMPEFANPLSEASGFVADHLFSDEVRQYPLIRRGEADAETYELDRAARIMRALLDGMDALGIRMQLTITPTPTQEPQ